MLIKTRLKPLKVYFNSVKASVFALCICMSVQCEAQSPVVKTNNGYIRGKQENESLVFKGIPYAGAPVGKWRFRAPQPALNHADTLSCLEFGSIASQFDGRSKTLSGSEDCLSLNVYSPSRYPKRNLPVLVWVHGGGMTGGSGKGENGHAFSDSDSVITVTINYRLGVFGFLYLDDLHNDLKSTGNNGLLDCIMALKWIRENISAFGGDPSKVTVMGESAGAKLVSTLLIAPAAKGYFQQMILESGAVQCIRDSTTAMMIRKRLMDTLQISRASDLLNMSTEQLIAAQNKVCGVAGTNYFGPVADGKTISGDPYQYLKDNPNRDVRLLIGTNKNESKLFISADKRLYKPEEEVLRAWFGNNYSMILSSYQKAARLGDSTAAASTALTQYMYQMHAYRLADVLARNGNPVWMYRFDYSPDESGASHAAELPYVWFQPSTSLLQGQEIKLAEKIHHAWVNFIKGRKPGQLDRYDWYWYKGKAKSIMVFDRNIHPELLTDVFNDPAYPTMGFLLSN